MKSDIAGVEGRDKMKAVQLRNDARSTRDYCKECNAILDIDHLNYSNNVFMFFEQHCEISFKFLSKAVAAIYLDGLPADASHLITTDIPLFYSFTRDREKFRSIDAVSYTFKELDNPPRGYSFGEIQVFQLEQGKLRPKGAQEARSL